MAGQHLTPKAGRGVGLFCCTNRMMKDSSTTVRADAQDAQSNLARVQQKPWAQHAGMHPSQIGHKLVELEQSVIWSSTMGSVLCVTRSGEGGIRAQKEAIRIAKERGDSLVFLYVADSSFLDKLTWGVVVDIEGILEKMGRFFMSMAIERALAENVRAESLVRHGVLREVLPRVVNEIDAETIILGHLNGDPSCFQRAEMDKALVSMRE
jgi:nucleotide-binding universal stress UspA family protein